MRHRSARAVLSIATILLLTLPALSGAAQGFEPSEEAEEDEHEPVRLADPLVQTTPAEPASADAIEVGLHEETSASTSAATASTHGHGHGPAHGDDERFPLEPRLASQSPYVTPSPTDVDDDPRHRARFVLDRNWGLSGSTFRAVANVLPQQGLTGIAWAFDAQPLDTTASTVDLHIVDAGLHFLTLTATWSDGTTDTVTSPIYVEDPAITLLPAVEQRAVFDPNGLGWLPPLAGRDATPLREHVLSVVEDGRLLRGHDAPTVLLISDFVMEEFELALLNIDLDVDAVLGGLSGADPTAGFGDFTTVRTDGIPETTPLGHDVTIVGQFLAEALIDMGVNVLFVGGIDKATGALDRAAIRNGILHAEDGGADAVVWGLPSATYLPAIVQNGMRPSFGFSETPQFAVDAAPYGYADWRQASERLPDYYVSVMEQLYQTAFLLDSHEPGTEVKDLADALWRERDTLPLDQQRLVSAFRNDQRFDEFLQDHVMRLADAGVAFVTPSEECAGMEDRFMTVLGANHVPGAVTVASGHQGSPDAIACKGPDRRAASHGTGVDFVADPRPMQEGPEDTGGVITPGDLVEDHWPEDREASYVPNSLGAATRVAAALGHLKKEVSSPERPWKAPDLVGMLAVQAESDSGVTPWEEGRGFLDIEGLTSAIPSVFPRATELTFLPYNPFEGYATGFLQLVLVGEETIAAVRDAPVESWGVAGGTEARFFTAPDGTPSVQTITMEDGTHMSVRVQNRSVENARGPGGAVLPDLGLATLTLHAYPTAITQPDILLANAASDASSEENLLDCRVAEETDLKRTIDPTAKALGIPYEHEDTCIPPDGTDDGVADAVGTGEETLTQTLETAEKTKNDAVADGEDLLTDAGGLAPEDPVPDVSDEVEEPLAEATEDLRRGDGQKCTILETELEGTVEPTAGAGGQDVDWNELCILPVGGPTPEPNRDWLLPGLYTGRTWISTPSNGILQLPINIGVGTIFDTHRFLAPDKPVSDTAVCLALPLKLVGDVTGLRQTVMELDDLNVCIYWANTDKAGVARFYTPLPIPYDLISFFSPQFQERLGPAELVHTDDRPAGGETGRAPPYYPQIHDSVTIVAPVNVTGFTKFASNAPDLGSWIIADPDPDHPDHPVFIDADLPYPLAMVYQNRTYPVAISVHWQYRDNMEATHILPIPSLLSPEFLSTLEAIPNPLHDLLLQATGAVTGDLSDLDGGLLTTAPERLTPLLGTAQDAIKEGMPVSSSTVDALLGQPVTRALPVSLQPDPGTCSWGYGHDLAPEMRRVVDDVFDADAPLDGLMDALDADLGEEAIPDTLTMRVEPTIEHLLGLTTNIPLCTAVYPFNLPQPNEDTFFIHEFDLHLESTVLVVCLQVALVECYILAPNPLGDGVLVIDTQAALQGLSTDLLTTDPDRTMSNVQGLVGEALGQTAGLIPDVQNLTLPDKIGLATDGHVALQFEQYTKDRDHGYLSYIALPLDLSASGFLDPLVGVLEENGLALEDVFGNLTLDTPLGEVTALSDVSSLVRDSVTDLLRTQPYVEIQRPVFLFDTWWWDDSFFDARVAPTKVLPRATNETVDRPGPDNEWFIGEDFWWLTFPNINQEYFRRGVEYWDPVTLKPDTDRMQSAGYPWNQPEFFEAVLEFWDDEEIDDITPNQFHIHSAQTFHQSVQGAKHCTNDEPDGSQRCFQTGLDFDEGNGWLMHDDTWGNGVYDPNQGLKAVMLNDLGVVDGLLGTVDGLWQSVVGTQVGLPLFGTPGTLSDTVFEQTGIDLSELDWWKRDGGPTANRRVYSDMYQNSSYFLSTHTKTCEERAGLPHQAPFFTDHQPRWKSDCPWEPTEAAKQAYIDEGTRVGPGGTPVFPEGWIPANPAAPTHPSLGEGHWDWKFKHPDTRMENRLWGATENGWHRSAEPTDSGDYVWHHTGVRCESEAWQTTGTAAQREQAIIDFYAGRNVTLAPEDVSATPEHLPYEDYCGNFDGWHYQVTAPDGFDGNRTNVWTHYVKTLHPTFHRGTFGVNFTAWNAACDDCGRHPIQDAWSELVGQELTHDHQDRFYDPVARTHHNVSVDGTALVLAMFGMSEGRDLTVLIDDQEVPFTLFDVDMGHDLQERYVTVPVDRDPDHWFSENGTGSEFGIFYREPVWDELDADRYQGFPQHTWMAMVKDAVAANVEEVRQWVETSPYFDDVSGQRVPFQDLMRPRISADPENPRLVRSDGSATPWFGCVGVSFHGHCRDRVVSLDAGDLSVFGRAGFWGRETKAKDSNIPQGSLYVRWNADHWVRDENGTAYSTIDPVEEKDVDQCWFRSTDGHGEAADGTHLETRPFFTTSWHDPFRAGTYNHESNGRTDPVPPMFRGKWCQLGEAWMPARGDREYVDMRLPEDFNGGDPTVTIKPPLTPYVFEGGTEADLIGVKFGVGNDDVTALLLAILNDVLGITNSVTGDALGTATGGVGQGLVTLTSASETVDSLPGVGVLGVGDVVQDAVDLTEGVLGGLLGGSPVVPVAHVAIDPSVAVAEMVVVHDHAFPSGTQGVFLASTDLGETWHLLPARGAPGFVGSSDSSSAHLAFVDLSQFRGESVLVGSRVLGDDWTSARWDVHRVTVLPAGVGKAPSPPISDYGAATTGFVPSSTLTLDGIRALDDDPAAKQNLLLDAPLVIPAGETVELTGVDIVSGSCGERSCPLRVDGSLILHGGTLAPATGGVPGQPNVGTGFPVAVTGLLEATGIDVRGLLGGLHVLGGEVRLSDCRLVDTGHVGALVLLGTIEMTGCVVADQVLGVYALGSQVRVEDNLFYRNVRSAGVFDDSWGVVRDNKVFHTKQGGFQVKGPLGASDLALFGNHVEQVGGGINSVASLEDRVLSLDPRHLSVPVDMRDRIQDNWFEWNNLEAVDANALSAPVIYNNEATHSNIGVRVGWLDAATIRYNTLYSDKYAWQDPEDRATPPDDGNVWAGLWQILSPGLSLEVDARDNYYGPGPVETDAIWPSDVILHDQRVTYLPVATEPVDRPLSAALTAPGYGGGLVPVLGQTIDGVFQELQPEQALSLLTEELRNVPGQKLNADLLDALPLDLVEIDHFKERPVDVTVDVAPGITSVGLEATFYGFLNPPDLSGVVNTEDLRIALDALPITDPTEVLNDQVTRTEPYIVDIPAGATHGTQNFTFDGLNESRVEWRIVNVTDADGTRPVDAVAAKNAVVHNSLVWPLLPELVFLVNDLGFQVLDEVGGAVDNTLAGAFLTNDPKALDDLHDTVGAALRLMPDGTLAVDGVPSLVGLVRDQDPVRSYEFRYRLSTEPDKLLKLDDGLNPSRASGLPALEEGVTLAVQGRAMDASNLASPFLGASVLVDRHPPELELSTECIAGPDRGIQYAGREWRDPAWGDDPAYRPSGMGTIQLKARVLPDGAVYEHEVIDHGGSDVEGEWILPAPAMLNGAVYAVTGTADDRAGHVASAFLPKVVVDLTAPEIDIDGILDLLLERDLESYLNLLDVTDLGMLLQAVVDDTPEGILASCGLDWAALQLRLDASDDPEAGWIDLARVDVPDDEHQEEATFSYTIPVDELLAWDGRHLQVRVVAQDNAGHRNDVTTPNLLMDLLPPLPLALPELPVCVGPNTTDTAVSFTWGATDPAPPVGTQSGLQKVRLLALRSDATMQVLDESPDLDGPATWTSPTPYDWTPLVSVQEGQLFFLVDARDRAGNGDLLTQADLTALTPEELDELLADAQPAAVDNLAPSVQPDDTLNTLVGELTALGLVPNLDQYVGGLPLVIKADVSDPAFSCLLDRVEVTLSATDGSHAWTTTEAVVDSSEHTVQVEVDLKLPEFAPFEGKQVDVSIRAVDQGGNEGWANATVGLVDLDPPTPFPVIDLCIGTGGGSFGWGATDPSTLPASGLAELELLLSGAVAASLDPGGALSDQGTFVPPTTSEGLLEYVARAVDRSSNVGVGTAAEVTIDLTAPDVRWLSDAANLVSFVSALDLTSTGLNLTALAEDPVGYSCGLLSAVLEYSLDNQTWQPLASAGEDGSLHAELAVAAHEGLQLHVRVRAEDKAGNQAVVEEHVLGPWLIDLTAPAIDLSGLPDFTSALGFTADWNVEDLLPEDLAPLGRTTSGVAGATGRLLVGQTPVGDPVEAGGTLVPVDIADTTELTVEVTARDNAGNAGTAARTVTVDLAPPTLELDPTTDLCIPAGQGFTMTYGGSDTGSGLAALRLIDVAGDIVVPLHPLDGDAAVTEGAASHSATVTLDLAPGIHYLLVDGVDAVGNGRLWTSADWAALDGSVQEELRKAGRMITVDGSAPTVQAVGDFVFLELEGAGKELADAAVGGNDLRVHAKLNDVGCGLSAVRVLLEEVDGIASEVLLDQSAQDGDVIDLTVDLDEARFDAFEGKDIQLVVELTDGVSNVHREVSRSTTMDTLDPIIGDLTDLTGYIPLAGIDLDWSTTDASPLVHEGARLVLRQAGQDDVPVHEVTRTTPDPVHLTGAGYHDEVLAVEVVATDAADNRVVHWVRDARVDEHPPTLQVLDDLHVDGTDLVATWDAQDAGTGVASVLVERFVDGTLDKDWSLEPDPSEVRDDPNGQPFEGRDVHYVVAPVDLAGNVGAEEQTKGLLATTAVPEVDLLAPTWLGRVHVDLKDLGLPFSAVEDVDDAVGDASLLSPGTRQDALLRFQATHGTYQPRSVTAEFDGQPLALTATGGEHQAVLPLATAPTNVALPLVVEVVAENDLVTRWEHDFYVADETTVAQREDTATGWSLSGATRAGETDSSSTPGTVLRLPDATAPATATLALDVPSPRISLSAAVQVTDRAGMDRVDLLRADGPAGIHAGIYLDAAGAVRLDQPGAAVDPTLATSLPTGWTTLRLLLHEDEAGVFIGRQNAGTYALAGTLRDGLTGVGFSADGATLRVDDLQVRTTTLGFRANAEHLPIVDDGDGWAEDGDGQLSSPTEGALRFLRLEPLGDVPNYSVVSRPQSAMAGSHMVLHFRVAQDTLDRTVVAALEGTSGKSLLQVYERDGRLFLSDGHEAGGSTPRPFLRMDSLLGPDWHRLDVHLVGERYVVVLDQTEQRSARTFASGGVGSIRMHNGDTYPTTKGNDLDVDRIRIDYGDGGQDHTFTGPLERFDWEAVQGGGTVDVQETQSGHTSMGRLALTGAATPGDATYVQTSTERHDGRYGAEASFRPTSNFDVPDNQAVLAGLDEDGDVNWAVVMARISTSANRWSAWYVAPDGARHQVGGDWLLAEYHTVRVDVDEANDRIRVFVDDDPTGVQYSGQDLGSSAHVAVGDVWRAAGDPTGYGVGLYDDVAVYPLKDSLPSN